MPRYLTQALDAIWQRCGPVAVVIHGAARGADTMAGAWAVARNVPVQAFPAQWDTFKKRAGPIRNQQMLTEGRPDLVIAFPGARGTAHMVGLAREAGVEVIEEPGRDPDAGGGGNSAA